MLNAKTILFGLSMLTAGLAPTVEAQAYSPSSQTASEVEKITIKDAAGDFNDWFDSLTNKDQKSLQFCFDKMLDKVGGLGSDGTLDDLHDIYSTLAKAIVSRVGKKTAKDLFSHDVMYSVYLAATTDSVSDWIDAIEDADLDLGWSEDDLESFGIFEDLGTINGAIVGMGVCAAGLGVAVAAGVSLPVAAGVAGVIIAAGALGATVGAAAGSAQDEAVEAVAEIITGSEDDC